MGYGKIEYVADDEKLEALKLLMNQYAVFGASRIYFSCSDRKRTLFRKNAYYDRLGDRISS